MTAKETVISKAAGTAANKKRDNGKYKTALGFKVTMKSEWTNSFFFLNGILRVYYLGFIRAHDFTVYI